MERSTLTLDTNLALQHVNDFVILCRSEAEAQAAAAAAEQARIEAGARAAAEAAERSRKAAERTTERAPKDPEAEKARREYRKSVLEGHPLTDRALAAKFPGRSRTWAGNRISEVKAMQQTADSAATG